MACRRLDVKWSSRPVNDMGFKALAGHVCLEFASHPHVCVGPPPTPTIKNMRVGFVLLPGTGSELGLVPVHFITAALSVAACLLKYRDRVLLQSVCLTVNLI